MISTAKHTVKFSKLSEKAFKPVKGSPLAAGFDLKSAYDYEVAPHERQVIKTDISVAVPEGCYGRIAPRSGLAVKHFIDVGAGVVDRDYRGNVGVVLFNFGQQPFVVKTGDKIAQLILEKIVEIDEFEEVENLDATERGADGFGSTGVHTEKSQEPDLKKMKTNDEPIEV